MQEHIDYAMSLIQDILDEVSMEQLEEIKEVLGNLVEISYNKGYDEGMMGFEENLH